MFEVQQAWGDEIVGWDVSPSLGGRIDGINPILHVPGFAFAVNSPF
jgi:hypothetical protein